ncbi:MAG: DoxX family protein [Alphaproteobacteria bacterium]|nr:DoxX family protein [Alphaproteobacteria bacterium]
MRAKQVAIWILRGLLAAVFVAAGTMKLIGVPRMVQEFGLIGFGQWFRFFTAAIEILGATLLFAPAARLWGALILLGVCTGAFIAQIGPLHGDLVHVFVIGGLVVLLLVLDLRSQGMNTQSR